MIAQGIVYDVAGRALVEISPACLFGAPLEGLGPSAPRASDNHLSLHRKMHDAELKSEIWLFFADVSLWANRCAEVGEDWQLVLGIPVNRKLLRKAMQWLYEHRTSAHDVVTLGLLETGIRVADEEMSMLVMRCREWCCVVMRGRPEAKVGIDPLGEGV